MKRKITNFIASPLLNKNNFFVPFASGIRRRYNFGHADSPNVPAHFRANAQRN
jgi:hypothetical protein